MKLRFDLEDPFQSTRANLKHLFAKYITKMCKITFKCSQTYVALQLIGQNSNTNSLWVKITSKGPGCVKTTSVPFSVTISLLFEAAFEVQNWIVTVTRIKTKNVDVIFIVLFWFSSKTQQWIFPKQNTQKMDYKKRNLNVVI